MGYVADAGDSEIKKGLLAAVHKSVLALFGYGAMSDLGLLCAQERTWMPIRIGHRGAPHSSRRASPRLPKSAGAKGLGWSNPSAPARVALLFSTT